VNSLREPILYRYSQFSVDRNIDRNAIINRLTSEFEGKEVYTYEYVKFYYNKNEWESEYFNINSITLHYVDFAPGQIQRLKQAIENFIENLNALYINSFIVTAEIPAEDTELIQALNYLKFRCIETRLHFLNNTLDSFDQPRYPVRKAMTSDIDNLKRIASLMRNEYDRFHADWSFDKKKADEYLEVYIENSINGFADLVITPNQKEIPCDSFLTANICRESWKALDYPISKMVLSAVSSQTNKGWYIKLITEMTYLLKEAGARSVFMNTQATNTAVLVTWQKLGYRMGRTTHILSFNTND